MQRFILKPAEACFWKEALAFGAFRAAHQRQRPADHLRRHPVPDGVIVVGEILLGDPDIHPIDPVGMGEMHVVRRGPEFAGGGGGGGGGAGRRTLRALLGNTGFGWHCGCLPGDFLRRLVLSVSL